MASIMRTIGKSAEAKKATLLIRLINHWSEIIGVEFAPKTSPIRIYFKKQMNKNTNELETIRILKLNAEGSLGTVIAMRQEIILQRLNTLFGTDDFKKLEIIHQTVGSVKKNPIKKEIIEYNLDLPVIDDPILKSRLESLGQAVMNSPRNNKG